MRLLRWKRQSNRMRQRVESGQRTYTEPTGRQRRKYRVTQRDFMGHLVWTIAPKVNAGRSTSFTCMAAGTLTALPHNTGPS